MRLLQLIFLLLWDGRPGLIRADLVVHAGRTLALTLHFDVYGNRKVLCKNPCDKAEFILVETFSDFSRNGRYSIELEHSTPYKLRFTIKDLTTSDSGLYWCGMESWTGQRRTNADLKQIILQVTDVATTSLPAVNLQLVVTSKINESPETFISSEETTGAPSDHRSLLWLLLIPVVMVMASVLLLLMWKQKKTQDSCRTQYVNAPVISRQNETEVYENCGPVSAHPDHNYQDLSPDTMDPNREDVVIDNYITVY